MYKNIDFNRFKKTGKIEDYLIYRKNKQLNNGGNIETNRGDNSKNS